MNYHFTNFCIEISTLRQVEAFNFPKIKLSSFENKIEKIKVEKVLYLNENVRDQDGYQDFQDPNRWKRSNRIVVIMQSLSRKKFNMQWMNNAEHLSSICIAFHNKLNLISLPNVKINNPWVHSQYEKLSLSWPSKDKLKLQIKLRISITAHLRIIPNISFAIRIFVADLSTQNRSMSIEDPVVFYKLMQHALKSEKNWFSLSKEKTEEEWIDELSWNNITLLSYLMRSIRCLSVENPRILTGKSCHLSARRINIVGKLLAETHL